MINRYRLQLKKKVFKTIYFLKLLLLLLVISCSTVILLSFTSSSTVTSKWENISEEGSFLVYRRQSLIGEESYSITTNNDSIIVKSLHGENERGRIIGVDATLHLKMDLTTVFYENRRITANDTINNLTVKVDADNVSVWESNHDLSVVEKSDFFPLHSNIPAAMEMMLYHYYFGKGNLQNVPTLPRGEVTVNFRQKDKIEINNEKVTLERYVVDGINWGGRTMWLDESKNLVASVSANTIMRERIKKGYEEALPFFVQGHVEEQMAALTKYTEDLKGSQAEIKALVGGDVIDGLSEVTKKDMTIIIKNDRIAQIGSRSEIEIPENAKIIDVTGKTLMPGLWDMHAHANQVQWAPAYLAGGITTIRDNGNELEFITAFRDAIDKDGALGPDILLAGMTDGAGIRGNGVVRATNIQEAKEVVDLFFNNGYRQIKIYNLLEPDVVKALSQEAHAKGMSVTGHVPNTMGNARDAIEAGIDHLSHTSRILTVLFPNKEATDLDRFYLEDNEITQVMINDAIHFLLKHKTVLDPTIALDVVRSLPSGAVTETVEPDVWRMAYELFEGKRYRRGLSAELSVKAKANYTMAMDILGQFYRAGVPIVAGSDNIVPVYSLYLEIETYQKLGGLTPLEAIKTATIIPARAMGIDSQTGTLEIGKEADIAILDKNPLLNISNIRTVTAVVTNGNYYNSKPLWLAADFIPREY